MASAPQAQGLPLLYNELVPLSKVEHGDWTFRQMATLPGLDTSHAVPVTVEEFPLVQRHYPIVFSTGPDPVPLALMGLNEGVNVFINSEGKFDPPNVYVPAYLRRYPFMLARLRPDAEELSLCFDPSCDAFGKFEDGSPLFEDGEPTKAVTDALAFCEQFEMSVQRTQQFVNDLKETGLLEEGEVSIQAEGIAHPYVYRGFQMVNEEKLREMRGDHLRKMNQNGMLLLLHAHLFSLTLVTDLFNRQIQQGKVPPQDITVN